MLARLRLALTRRRIDLEQIGLLHQGVEEPFLANQFVRSVKLSDPALLKEDDPVRVEDGVDAMGDGDYGPILKDAAAEGRLQERIRLDIDGSGRFVQDEDAAGGQ